MLQDNILHTMLLNNKQMQDNIYSSHLLINLQAIAHNYKTIKSRIAPADSAAVLKANAYGLGANIIAKKLVTVGCNIFFVAQLQEALELRKTLPDHCRICVLNGLLPNQSQLYYSNNIIPVINNLEELRQWAEFAQKIKQPLKSLLHVDTGMNRLGLNAHDPEILNQARQLSQSIQIEYVISHLREGEIKTATSNREQLKLLKAVVNEFFPGAKISLANSGGTKLEADFHQDLARPGVSLFGVDPAREQSGLRSAVELYAQILQINHIKAGQYVGYNQSFKAPKDMRTATLAIGYADGLFRVLSNKTWLNYKGYKANIVGNISMDLTIIDVSDIPEDIVKQGDLVEIIGANQPIEQLAIAANTIDYEILTSLGKRHKRHYIDE